MTGCRRKPPPQGIRETKGTHDVQLPPTVGHQTPHCTSLAFKTSLVRFQPSPINSKQMNNEICQYHDNHHWRLSRTIPEICQYHDNHHWRLSRTIPEIYLPNSSLQETLTNTGANFNSHKITGNLTGSALRRFCWWKKTKGFCKISYSLL